MVDPFADEPIPDAPVVPADSPLSATAREALTWARENGVVELDMPNFGRFVLKPLPPKHVPTMADLTAKLKGPNAGMDEHILYASALPYIPGSDDPIPFPGK